MGTSPIVGSTVAMVGEQVAAAVEEAAKNDPRLSGLADGEEVDALRALSAALSASEEFNAAVALSLAVQSLPVHVSACRMVASTSSVKCSRHCRDTGNCSTVSVRCDLIESRNCCGSCASVEIADSI